MGFIVFIFGLLFGSFYNVVGLRLPKGESIIKPGSHCPNCQHKLKWYENIPVFSYIFLLGKCKKCKTKISIIYPVIELITGILFLLCYLIFFKEGNFESFFISIILSSLVVIIFVSDSKYMIILDSPLIISGVLIFIIKIIYEGFIESLYSLGHGVLVFGIMYLLMLLGNFLFKKESLGGGDIKLSFIAGMVLGPLLGIFYIVFGAFLAFPYAIYVSIKNNDGMLPFGPFLAASMIIMFFNNSGFLEFINKLLQIK